MTETEDQIRVLNKKLQAAAKTFLESGTQVDGVPNDKAGAVAYLDAIHEHLQAQGLEPPLLRPLREITAAFRDAVNGKTSDLFRVTSKAGRPPLDTDRQALQATASVAVTRLMDTGLSEDQACNYVARKLSAMDLEFGDARSGAPMSSSLKFARERIMDGRAGDLGYTLYQRLLEFTTSMDARAAADTLLGGLSSLHRSKTV